MPNYYYYYYLSNETELNPTHHHGTPGGRQTRCQCTADGRGFCRCPYLPESLWRWVTQPGCMSTAILPLPSPILSPYSSRNCVVFTYWSAAKWQGLIWQMSMRKMNGAITGMRLPSRSIGPTIWPLPRGQTSLAGCVPHWSDSSQNKVSMMPIGTNGILHHRTNTDTHTWWSTISWSCVYWPNGDRHHLAFHNICW